MRRLLDRTMPACDWRDGDYIRVANTDGWHRIEIAKARGSQVRVRTMGIELAFPQRQRRAVLRPID